MFNKPYTIHGLQASIARACSRAGVKRWGPGRPRHNFATNVRAQFDIDAARVVLGHAEVTTTEIYALRDLSRAAEIAAARMEWAGVPIDAETLETLRRNWGRIKGRLIAEADADYGVFVPTGRSEVHQDIRSAADLWEVDQVELADAADYCWRAEKDATADFYEAKREARKITGLTVNRIN